MISFKHLVRSSLFFVSWTVLVLTCLPGLASAQTYPANGYYGLMSENSLYHMGELKETRSSLQVLYRSAYREGNVRWLDSAVYQALAGEVSYQMGDYGAAMDSFDESIVIYLNMIGWSARTEWNNPQPVQLDNNAVRRARITWGQPTRPVRVGRFPTYQVRFGQDIIIPGQNGNTRIPQERLVSCDVFEINRRMALAIHRRDAILGPLSKVDETSRLLRSQLSENRNLTQAAVPITLGSILYGVSLAGDGEFRKSNEILNGNLQLDGMDHPLTAVALMQIGYNQYMLGEYRAAIQTLHEASYSAAFFEQYDVFRESLILASRAHMAVNRDQPLPFLTPASEWARVHGLRMAQAQFAIVSAENDIENGNVASALEALDSAAGMLRTTSMARSVQTLRLELLRQISLVVAGKNNDLLALRRSLDTYRQQTLWWFQVKYLENKNKTRHLTTATLAALVRVVSRDPLPDDWDRDPIDSLAFLTGDRSQFVLSDMDLQIAKRSYDAALLTSELARRMEFLYRCPLGGRLMSIRELVTRQPAALTPDLIRRQQEVRSRFPGVEALMNEAEKLSVQLNTMPVNPAEDAQRPWLQLVEQWESQNQILERGFVNLSVRREAMPLLFPPPVDLERVQRSMPEKTLCLVIKQSLTTYHVFLVTKDKLVYQSSLNPRNVSKAIQGLAKMWGHTNNNAVLQKELIQSNEWKKYSNMTLQALIPNSTPQFWGNFEELVVVPDGQFWYLPFEALALEPLETSEVMLDKLAIRYAPSLGLAFSPGEPRRLDRVAFYPGKIDLADDDVQQTEFAKQFVEVWPKTMEVTQSSLTPAQVGPMVDAMILWNEIKSPAWPVPTADRPKKSEVFKTLDLELWPYLPNNGPALLMINGANTAFANGARKSTDTGNEIGFYSTLLMASGCSSVVMPRWRSGGNIPYEMQLELAKQLQRNQPTAMAMRKSMQHARETKLDPANQPRVRLAKQDTDVTADHPFFWASYMVIDRGQWYGDQAPDNDQPLKLGGSGVAETKPEDAEKDEMKDESAAKEDESDQAGEGKENDPAVKQPEREGDPKKEADGSGNSGTEPPQSETSGQATNPPEKNSDPPKR